MKRRTEEIGKLLAWLEPLFETKFAPLKHVDPFPNEYRFEKKVVAAAMQGFIEGEKHATQKIIQGKVSSSAQYAQGYADAQSTEIRQFLLAYYAKVVSGSDLPLSLFLKDRQTKAVALGIDTQITKAIESSKPL